MPTLPPIKYLVLIGQIQLLPLLYGQIVIPREVYAELTDAEAPLSVREWMRQLPAWIEVRQVSAYDPSLQDLDAGESAAI